jgi:hypothetical protein
MSSQKQKLMFSNYSLCTGSNLLHNINTSTAVLDCIQVPIAAGPCSFCHLTPRYHPLQKTMDSVLFLDNTHSRSLERDSTANKDRERETLHLMGSLEETLQP